MTTAVTPEPLFKLGFGFWASKTFLSAVELGLFTELARGPLTAEALRERLQLHPRGARDFFDALVALGVLGRENDQYSNTPEADLFLDRNKLSYMGGILEMAGGRLYRAWGGLTESLRTGKQYNEAGTTGNPFDALYADEQSLENFLRAMTGVSMGPAMAIAAKFPWREYRSFIDIGCAQGVLPVQVARAHPHLSGGGFDLPAVKPVFERYAQANGVADKLKFYPGDFFNDPLPQADVLVMGHILHDWDMQQKRMLIEKAYAALPAKGAFIIYEALIDDDRRWNASGLLMSLNMLIETPGGFDYTGADCKQWLRAAGFGEVRVEHLNGGESMVVAIK